MAALDLIAGLLEDLDTLAQVAESGVLLRREARLEPGETRPAAILFLDIAGFTELSKRLDSAQLSLLIDRTFRIFELTVRSQGGYWDARFGDAALYVFPGHPNHPPACRAALLAGLGLLDRARQIARSLDPMGLSLAIRAGVSFGEVTRQHVGGADKPLTVMGDTVNLAQRLEASAQPMTLQTTVRVLDQAGTGFQSEYRDAFELKGFGRVEVHRVQGYSQPPVRLRGSARRLTPLIGRDALLNQAAAQVDAWLDFLAQAGQAAGADDTRPRARGQNRLVIIHGATAVGKSRFAFELVEKLREGEAVLSATAHCTELASLLDFGSEVAACAGLDSSNLPKRWEKLCNLAAELRGSEYAQRARSHLPVLALLLDCVTVDATNIRRADAKSFLVSAVLALRACLELVSLETGQPIVVVFEDLQWMGELEEIIRGVVETAELSYPLIIVATARDDYTHTEGALGEAELCLIELEPLTAAQGDEMFAALLPGLDLPVELRAELHERAIGIPYYYEEFARMLLRRGLVAAEGEPGEERYRLTQPLAALEMPSDLAMLVLGRLDQLAPWLRELTGRLSVWGRYFELDLHGALEARLGLLDTDRLREGIRQLRAEQFLDTDTGERFYFEHLLVRDAAYGALLRGNRLLLHLNAAAVLQERLIPGGSEESGLLPELALHLEYAGQFSDAHQRQCQFLSLKAQTGRFDAWEQAEAAAQRSWDLLRLQNPGLPPVSHMLLNAQGTRHRMTGDWEAAGRCYREALQIVNAQGDRRTEASLLNNLGSLLRGLGDPAGAAEHYLRALELSREFGRARLEAVVLRNMGALAREEGRTQEAEQLYQESLAISQRTRDLRNTALCLDNLGMVFMDRWMAQESEDCFNDALSIMRDIGNTWGEALVLGDLGLLRMKYMRLEEARALLDQSIVLAIEAGDPRLEGETLGKRANLLLRQGLPKLAQPDLRRALELLSRVGNPFQTAFVHCQFVFYHLALGHADSANRSFLEAEHLARQIGIGPSSALWREIEKTRAATERAKEKSAALSAAPREA